MASDTSEDDDNMVVLLVGDEEHSKDSDQHIQVPCPLSIKVEPLDEGEQSGSEIFKSSALDNIKQEFLEEFNIKKEIEGEEEFYVEYLEEDLFEENNGSDEEYVVGKRKRRPPAKTGPRPARPKIVSLVAQLRRDYPELAEDPPRLVEHLSHIMRKMKAPKPPANYCKTIILKNEIVKYECSYCGKQTETPSLAGRHYQFKHGECYLTCYACGVQYRNTTNLYKHEKKCSAPDARIVLQARGFYLGRKGRGRPFTTTNRFITANTPAKKGKKRLFCTKCPASFCHRENLQAHENSHEGVRPFLCNLCPVAYTSAPALKRHERAVHGDDQFICDHCGNSFKLKPALISHLDSHRPIRKHPCLYCPRRFSQKVALQHHTTKVHLHLPAAHGCPMCPKRYARMTHVKDHLLRVHGLTMITRRMYYHALPTMGAPPSKVVQAKLFYNHSVESNETPVFEQVEQIVESQEIIQDWPPIEYIELDLRDNADQQEIETTEIETTEIDTTEMENMTQIENEPEIEVTTKIETVEETPEYIEPIRHVGRKKGTKNRTKTVTTVIEKPEPTEEDIKRIIEKSIEESEQMIEIKSKRERKSAYVVPDNQPVDQNMYKIVREIKSTLKRPTLQRTKNPEYINQERFENSNEPEEHVIENVPTIAEKPDSTKSNNIRLSRDDATDWEMYKKVSEKDQVVAEFLEYMKSGIVPRRLPKSVPILRRKSQDSRSPTPASEWLKKSRDEKPVEEEESPSADVTETPEVKEETVVLAEPKREKRTRFSRRVQKHEVPFVEIKTSLRRRGLRRDDAASSK